MKMTLVEIIQLAITPVILISGMGALMLTLTNRMGRIVDRTRSLAGLVRAAAGPDRAHHEEQLDILWRRALLIRRAVTFNGLSMLVACVLVACVLVVVVFTGVVLGWNIEVAVIVLFEASLVLLIASLVTFLQDIFLSLRALRLEVDQARAAVTRVN
jgi:hypothetical protein